MVLEILKDAAIIVWTILTWPFAMAGLGIALAFMWTITKLGFWHKPDIHDNKGHWNW